MDYLENRTYDEIQLGDSASLTRTLTEKDIQVFAIMSGDINPAHVDIEYAQSDMFHKIIGHGMWGAALISTVLGTELPGPGTIYLSQTIKFKRPVTIGDTLKVSVTATEKNPEKNRITFLCECRNQKDEVVIDGQAEVIAPTKKIRRPKVIMPEISLRRTSTLFKPYLEKAKKLGILKAGVIYPVHSKLLEAIDVAHYAGLIQPVLIGPESRIIQAAKLAHIDISAYEIIDVHSSYDAIQKAIQLVRNNDVDLLIRGAAVREELIDAIQKPENGMLTNRSLSYIRVLDIPTYPKPLILTDSLTNNELSPEVVNDITQNSIHLANALGIEKPKVVKLDITQTIDKVIPVDLASEGKLSPLINDADILIVPDIETGNILARQLEYLAESRNAGLVLGGKVPVLISHIHDVHLSAVSCALAILAVNHTRSSHD